MRFEEPYFMQNKDWYYHDEEEGKYKLTDKAPEQAKKSYDDFYKKKYRTDDDEDYEILI